MKLPGVDCRYLILLGELLCIWWRCLLKSRRILSRSRSKCCFACCRWWIRSRLGPESRILLTFFINLSRNWHLRASSRMLSIFLLLESGKVTWKEKVQAKIQKERKSSIHELLFFFIQVRQQEDKEWWVKMWEAWLQSQGNAINFEFWSYFSKCSWFSSYLHFHFQFFTLSSWQISRR